MFTSCPVSTVSYNTVANLKKCLNRLIKDKVITFYAFINHLPEDDEKKEHIHLYVVPNKRIDTDSLREYFVEPVKGNKPLCCMPFYSSKWSEWYLYALHDAKYLESKCDTRKYHYKREEFTVSDDLYFNELIHTINYSKYVGSERFINAVKSGMSWKELCMKGIVPIGLVGQYQRMFDTIKGRDNRDKENLSLNEMVALGFTLESVLQIYNLPDSLVPLVTDSYNNIKASLTEASTGVSKGGTLCAPENTEK